ncbi:MAG: hypothetical protein FJ104_13820, partial [Deltaproteobacteria bacterium]|nr:hypothetical protein [Deltaproteobacteria bacterium]
AEACAPGNLLLGRAPRATAGIAAVEHLTDGWLTVEGHPAQSSEAALFQTEQGFAEWDLGEVQRLRAGAVQADNNDVYRLLISEDGVTFLPAWILGAVEAGGLRERTTNELDVRARFVRLEAVAGDAVRSVAEVRLFCQIPDPWPPSRVVRRAVQPDPTGLFLARVQNGKLAFGLLAVPLLVFGLPRLRRPALRRGLVALVIGLSGLFWVHFGKFHGNTAIHHYDAFHYFIGTKYFPELGYFELYRCTAAVERAAGRGDDLDRHAFRDLDDNQAYPGTWTRSHEGRCRADFSAARWKEFTDDIERFRQAFPPDWAMARAFSDHGFNATPVHLGMLRLVTAHATPTRELLHAFVAADVVALGGAVAALTWGFGPVAGGVSAVVAALGFPWSYHWVGGGIARHFWIFAACAGLALVRRGRQGAGLSLLTVAALLRLFPILFLGAGGLWVLGQIVARRSFSGELRRSVGVVAVTAALGLGFGAAANGVSSYSGFADVVTRHSGTPLGNHMGLASLLSAKQGHFTDNLRDTTLTDPFEVWSATQRRNRDERRPLQLAVLGIAAGYLVWAIRRGASLDQAIALGGPLVFAAIPLTSYDYVWVLLLAPLVVGEPRRLVAWAGFAWGLLFLATAVTDIELQHFYDNVFCLAFLIWLLREHARGLLAAPPPPSDVAAAG